MCQLSRTQNSGQFLKSKTLAEADFPNSWTMSKIWSAPDWSLWGSSTFSNFFGSSLDIFGLQRKPNFCSTDVQEFYFIDVLLFIKIWQQFEKSFEQVGVAGKKFFRLTSPIRFFISSWKKRWFECLADLKNLSIEYFDESFGETLALKFWFDFKMMRKRLFAFLILMSVRNLLFFRFMNS